MNEDDIIAELECSQPNNSAHVHFSENVAENPTASCSDLSISSLTSVAALSTNQSIASSQSQDSERIPGSLLRNMTQTLHVDTQNQTSRPAAENDDTLMRIPEDVSYTSDGGEINDEDDGVVGQAIPKYKIDSYPSYKRHFFRSFFLFGKNVQSYCNICLPLKKNNEDVYIKIKSKGIVKGNEKSTTNWLRHMRTSHKRELEGFESKTTQSLPNNHTSPSVTQHFAKIPKFSKNRQQELDDALVKMFSYDNMPLNLLRRTGFRNFIEV